MLTSLERVKFYWDNPAYSAIYTGYLKSREAKHWLSAVLTWHYSSQWMQRAFKSLAFSFAALSYSNTS